MGTVSELGGLLRMGWSLLLGNIVEWYEFAVYGYMAVYLETIFFRGSAIATWLGFTVTFLARPVGGVVVGFLGDVFGRRFAVNVSIAAMLVGTCGQGLLPTYACGSDTAGLIGVVLLICLRVLQGVSAAGEISMISTYVTEAGSPEYMGRSIALLAITGNLGFLSAKAVVYALQEMLGDEAMRSWGWRVPFLFAIVPGSIAMWGRRWLPETKLFLEEQQKKQRGAEEPTTETCDCSSQESVSSTGSEVQPEETCKRDLDSAAVARQKTSISMRQALSGRIGMMDILRSHGHSVLIGIFSVASIAALNYGGLVWGQSYLMRQGLSARGQMLADFCARGLMISLAVPVGWLADVKGVGWVTFVGSCLAAVGCLPLFAVLVSHPTDLATTIAVVGVGFGTIGALAGTVIFCFVTELFPTAVRGVAMGISWNVGLSIFGGLAPVLAEASLEISSIGPGVLFSLSGIITACTVVVAMCLKRRGVVQLAHVRPVPYFAPFDVRQEAEKGATPCDDNEQLSDEQTSDKQTLDNPA